MNNLASHAPASNEDRGNNNQAKTAPESNHSYSREGGGLGTNPWGEGEYGRSLWCLLALSFFLVGFALQHLIADPLRDTFSPAGELVVKARIEKGATIELYLNGVFDHSYQQPIIADRFSEYRFKNLPGRVSFFRLDPTDAIGAEIEINEVTFRVGDRVVARLLPSDLENVSRHDLSLVPSPTGGEAEDRTVLRLTSSGNDPILQAGGLNWGGDLTPAGPLALVLTSIPHLLLGAGALFLCWGPLGRSFVAFSLLCGVVSLVIGVVTTYLANSVDWPIDSFAKAVGWANYVGHSKLKEKAIFLGSVLVSLFFAVVLSTIGWSSRKSSEVDPPVQSERFSRSFLLVTLSLFTAAILPDFTGSTSLVQTMRHEVSNFDLNNIRAWNFLWFNGLLPHRDYWFPYGGYFNQMGLLPSELVWVSITRAILGVTFLASVYRLLNHQKLPTFLVGIVVATMIEAGIAQGTIRYLVSINLVLAFIALQTVSTHRLAVSTLYGALVAWSFFMEPNQIIYAAPSLGVTFITFFVIKRSANLLKSFLFYSLISATVAFIGIGMQLAIAASTGQLKNLLRFFENMSAMAVSASLAAPISEWFLQFDRVVFFVLLGILSAIMMAGLHGVTSQGLRERRAVVGLTMLGLGLTGSLVFSKMLLRPHMTLQVLLYPFLAVLLGFCMRWRLMPLPRILALFCFTGMIYGFTASQVDFAGLVKNWAFRVVSAPSRLRGIAAAFAEQPQLGAKLWRAERFQGWPPGGEEIITFLQHKALQPSQSNIYVLGDQSNFYLALDQAPPRYLTFYDGANLDAQQEVVSWLAAKKPSYVILDRTARAFDSVPNLVRVPLIFAYVATHYEREGNFGSYDLLRLKDASSVTLEDWQYFIERWGSMIEFGFIPTTIRYEESAECSASAKLDPSCVPFIFVNLGDSHPGGKVDVPLRIGGHDFTLSSQSNVGAVALYLPLHRTWFYELARQAGDVEISVGATAIGRSELKFMKKDEGRLY